MTHQPPPGFTCPRCGRTSYHPEDLRQGYCGACHDFTGSPAAVEEADVEHLAGVITDARLAGIVAGPATLARYILAAGYRRLDPTPVRRSTAYEIGERCTRAMHGQPEQVQLGLHQAREIAREVSERP